MMTLNALLILDGDKPTDAFYQTQSFDLIIATDGAAHDLVTHITPDIIIGDFDSLKKTTQKESFEALQALFPKSQLIEISEQETTDFEKALLYLTHHHPKISQLTIVGMHGQQLDHALNNLLVMQRYADALPMVFYHEFEGGKQWGTILLAQRYELNAQIGQNISLLGLPEAVVSAQGLKWPLAQFHLNFQRSSVRNRAEGTQIQVHIHEGKALIVIDCAQMPDLKVL